MIQTSSTASLSSVRRLTFEAYRRAEAMGLVEPAQPTEEFDLTGVRKVLQGVRDAGIARSPVIELENADADAPDPNNVAELMKMVIADARSSLVQFLNARADCLLRLWRAQAARAARLPKRSPGSCRPRPRDSAQAARRAAPRPRRD